MRRIAILSIFIVATAFAVSAQQTSVESACKADKIIKHWDNSKAPHSNEESREEAMTKDGHIKQISQTVFYLYRADKAAATGQSVVILPGGGYGMVCIEREGFALAEYFKSIGITALVVKYRLPNYGHKEVPLEDAQAALAYLRKHSKELGIDPAKVGIAGSSAGGHLAAYTSTFTPDDAKPAFAVLFYPVISAESCMTHQNTFYRLLGKTHSAYQREYYSLNNRVTETTPPTIIFLSNDDRTVPPISSVLYYNALKHYGVKASMHVYPEGGHGWVCDTEFRYDKEWRMQLQKWLAWIDGSNETKESK